MATRSLPNMRPPALLLIALVASCGIASNAPTSTTTVTTTIGTTTTATSLAAGTTEAQPVVGCPADPAFVDHGRVTRLDQPTSDTRSLGLISWQVDDGCERFGIDFETTEGAPATTPPTVVVDFLETRQILRIWMDVASTVVTDQLVETPLVDRLFVVRALEGGMFIDIHLSGPALARVAISNSPARMSLELQAGTDPLVAAPAAVTEDVVVVSPSIGIETSAEADVSGYVRTFEGNVLVRATVADSVVAETSATAADWVETWGEFRASITLPTGQVNLFVGEMRPDDGQPVGANLSLTVR